MRITFTINLKDFTGISKLSEFYHGVPGLCETIEKYGLKPYHAFMNRKSCEKLLDYMLSRVPIDSVTRYQWEVVCSHDWLNNAPNVTNDAVPPNEIWVELPESEVA